MKGVTPYRGISQLYFRHLLEQIARIGNLRRPGTTILDFGCGQGQLKRLLPGVKVIGYDVIPSLSDVPDWRAVDFDILVANEVFYAFKEADLEKLLLELKRKNPKMELVVGISRQGLLNNIGKHLLGRPGAHSATQMGPRKELEVLERHCQILKRKNVLTLAGVYSMVFRTP